MKPEPTARTAPKRDPAKTASGKVVFHGLLDKENTLLLGPGLAAQMYAKNLTDPEVTDACYYLDGLMFLPKGGVKVGRALRDEAKKRGIL